MSLPPLHCFPVPSLSSEQSLSLQEAARAARVDAVTMVEAAKSGHPGGAFSSMEMFLIVYGVANLTPENAGGLDRDYVVVSHGHTSAGVYAALAAWGFFDSREAVAHFQRCGSVFQGTNIKNPIEAIKDIDMNPTSVWRDLDPMNARRGGVEPPLLASPVCRPGPIGQNPQ